MNNIRQKKIISFADNYEYQSVRRKLESDLDFTAVRKIIKTYNDAEKSITYLTEEITPDYKGNDRIKVLLLFKNPHPDSVAAGLFFSEKYSKSFWNRFFEVDCNKEMLSLLKSTSWCDDVAQKMLYGMYNGKILYYFRCFYPFPTKKFSDLQKLFPKKSDVWKKNFDNSLKDLMKHIKGNKINYVIIFFKDGFKLLGGTPIADGDEAVKVIKRGIDKYLCKKDNKEFWQTYIANAFKQRLQSEGLTLYFNINTRHKNDGDHLFKSYFTYNLELILEDILSNTVDVQ